MTIGTKQAGARRKPKDEDFLPSADHAHPRGQTVYTEGEACKLNERLRSLGTIERSEAPIGIVIPTSECRRLAMGQHAPSQAVTVRLRWCIGKGREKQQPQGSAGHVIQVVRP